MTSILQILNSLVAATAPLVQHFVQEETWLEWLKATLRQKLGPPLKALHQPFDDWLGSLPMSVAMICVIGLYVIAVAWVWMLSREFVFRGSPDRKWWRDLRIWATLVVIPYVAVYLMLGR